MKQMVKTEQNDYIKGNMCISCPKDKNSCVKIYRLLARGITRINLEIYCIYLHALKKIKVL